MKISIVIPIYNEETSIGPLVEEIESVMNKEYIKDYEIIIVDDGSNDKTFEVVKLLHKKLKNIKGIRFNRNFGKSSALSAGFETATGDIIITLDGDLQDNPSEIPKFLKEIGKGYDLVVGWRRQRKDFITRIVTSKIFNLLVRILTKVKLHDSDCNFRALRKNLVKELNIYGGLYRYIPVIANSKGYKITEIEVKHRQRKSGKSKYGVTRLFKGFFDLLTIKFLISYKESPLYLFGFLGSLLFFIGMVFGFYLLYLKYILMQTIGNRPLLLLAILLVVLGVQFISLGLIAEMIISPSDKSKKNYTIKEILK